MKSIAITIDEPTLERVDRLLARGHGKNRSAVVRRALARFLEAEERCLREQDEAAVLAKNKAALAREARALVADQAEP
jgi:Arc/MetJ-type ribon-helix-helix transcriptional regulator